MSQTQLVTPYNGEVWFRNMYLPSLGGLQYQINDVKTELNNIRTDILMMVIADPQYIASDNVLYSVKERVNDILDDYANAQSRYEKLRMISNMIDIYAVNNNVDKESAFDAVVPDMFKDLHDEINKNIKPQTNEAGDK